MFPRFPRFLVFLLLSALIAIVGGCSKKRPVTTDLDLTQAEADDLMHQFAAMAATDSGGWVLEVQSVFNGWSDWKAEHSPPSGTGAVTPRDTAFNRDGMAWSVTFSSEDSALATHAGWDSVAVLNMAFSNGVGRLSITGIAGDYRHKSDTLFVDGLHSSTDTLSFDMGAGAEYPVDSATISLAMGAASAHYFLDNLIDYHAEMLKHPPSLPAYPVAGDASITVLADVLRDASRGTFLRSLDAEIDVTFDGTATPLATVRANIDNPLLIYHYRIDLKTGAVTRAP